MPLCASSVRVALTCTALLIAAAPAQAAKPAEKPDAARVAPSALPPNAPRHFDATEAIAHDPATRTDGSDDIVTLRHDAADRMTVMVEIGTVAGTHSAFAFLVDTGAERTVVARSVVNALGLVPNGRGRLIGMAGAQDVDLVSIESIMLGRRSLFGLASPVLDAQTIGADGIIGLDGLQGQRILLDFDHNTMLLGTPAALGGDRGYDIVVRARRKSGQLIMTDALVDGVRTDIVIDTGSDTTIGNAALARALVRDHRQDTVQLVSVTGQKATAELGLARTLALGGMTLNNTLIAFSDAPPFEKLGLRRRPALLLGMAQLRLFHRVAIDFAARRILFDLPGSPRG